jgi:hypothetical protein
MFDDRQSGDTDDHHNGDDADILNGIWASLSSPSANDQPSVSVESIKERLKRGAALRRAALGERRDESETSGQFT